MFLEDALEVTGLQVTRTIIVYYIFSFVLNSAGGCLFQKEAFLALAGPQKPGEHAFNERAAVVDPVPLNLLTLIQQQVSYDTTTH